MVGELMDKMCNADMCYFPPLTLHNFFIHCCLQLFMSNIIKYCYLLFY